MSNHPLPADALRHGVPLNTSGSESEIAVLPLSIFRMHFEVLTLKHLIGPTLTIDGAWGALEELSLKRALRGEQSGPDNSRRDVLVERLYQAGFIYVATRPEWQVHTEGVLQLVNAARLVARLPAVAGWAEKRTFAFLRSRLHELT